MSFLNPVNEPVTRFSSTDADAPQIDYNARVAGDVKAVLKACLVTGYGDKASAGWSIVNEADHVAEFASPSAAMSDFKLQIDDALSTKTDFNYITGADESALISSNYKTDNYADTTPNYNWHLFATDSSLFFVEIITHRSITKPIGRLTFYGTLKSALQASNGSIFFGWASGWGLASSTQSRPTNTFVSGYSSSRPLQLNEYQRNNFMTANQSLLESGANETNTAAIDLWSDVYLDGVDSLIAQVVGVLFGLLANTNDIYNTRDLQINGRPCFQFFLAASNSRVDDVARYGFNVAIRTDYWEV